MTEQRTLNVGEPDVPRLSRDGRTMIVSIPIRLRHQKGRKQMVAASGVPVATGPEIRTRSCRQHACEGDRTRASLSAIIENPAWYKDWVPFRSSETPSISFQKPARLYRTSS
jgi:hypothetical protein